MAQALAPSRARAGAGTRTLLRRAAPLLAALLCAWSTAAAQPLPSWNDGVAKTRIMEFVRHVTDSTRASFVPRAERIAVFDNDGTLWSEQPLYFQLAFMLDEVKAAAPAPTGFGL